MFLSPLLGKVLLVAFIAYSAQLLAKNEHIELHADKIITELYHSGLQQKSTMDSRINYLSEFLITKPYLLGALGEGREGQHDQTPLYRMDAFDCETYVDTVLSLALANNLTTFKQCIRKVRYDDGKVSFITRNHFSSLDWNPNNQRLGFTKDITKTFKNEQGEPVALLATAIINKPSWYKHFTLKNIRLSKADEKQQHQQLLDLKQQGSKLPVSTATILYIPLTVLFDKEAKPNHFLFKQIPNSSIIEIVRPNWDLSKQIGTHLNVSHMGFGIWKEGILFFRQASSTDQKIIDIPMVDYLRKALPSTTIKGINVQVILPKSDFSSNCD